MNWVQRIVERSTLWFHGARVRFAGVVLGKGTPDTVCASRDRGPGSHAAGLIQLPSLEVSGAGGLAHPLLMRSPPRPAERAARFLEMIGNPRLYETHILRQRVRHGGDRQGGASLAAMAVRSRHCSRLLANEVKRGTYEPDLAERQFHHINGKSRTIIVRSVTDRIVCAVVADALVHSLYPEYLPRSVYSYRKGCSSKDAIGALTRYLREHQRRIKNPRERGLYLLRRDVQDYTDTIPVHSEAPLWSILCEALGPGLPDATWRLLHDLVCPRLLDDTGCWSRPLRGVPTGTAICPVIYNLYLVGLDRTLEAIPGAFYARFCDDLLFAHHEPGRATDAHSIIETHLEQLGLANKLSKQCDIYFNGAGRTTPRSQAFSGSAQLDFLGMRVSFKGTVSIPPKKQREVLREIRTRVASARTQASDFRPDEVVPLLCRIVNNSINPNHPLALKHAHALRTLVTDRDQLQQLDYEIALAVAGAAVGRRGVRAFRHISYQELRTRHHLRSLVVLRNGLSPHGIRRR